MPTNQPGHLRSGSLNIPPISNGHPPPMPGSANQRLDGPRSPPNTSHVPCKFFRQGGCQAGTACPFSHDLGAASENICKYFAKGNCKFGPKCANIHILPDGRRINYGKNGVTFGNNAMGAIPGRAAPSYPPTTSNLTNSFLSGNQVPTYGPNTPGYGGFTSQGPDDNMRVIGRQASIDNGIPIIDTTHAYSHNGSAYGSPRDADTGLEGLSPVNKGLSVLDAPLPASFDSNGISHVARYPNGPFPSSVPNQFGGDSPSPSLHFAKEARTSDTLKMLHTSAFGSNDHLSPNAVGASSSSPPSNDDHRRAALHSSSNSHRYSRSRMISASVPKGVDRDWGNEFPFAEEDYVPENLKDLLTPTEKARRGSLRAEENEFIAASGPYSSSHTVKFGSPIPTASPSSRWGPGGWNGEAPDDKNGRPRYGASPFGHVGSPLRNSSLIGSDLNSTAAGTSRPNGPPSRRGTGSNESLSVLTQQIQKTKLESDSASSGSSPRVWGVNGGGNGRHVGSEREKSAIERHVSSSSIGSSRLAAPPIDEEEEGEFVFDMDEDDVSRTGTRKPAGSTGFSSWNYTNNTTSGLRTNGGDNIPSTNGHMGSSRKSNVIGQ